MDEHGPANWALLHFLGFTFPTAPTRSQREWVAGLLEEMRVQTPCPTCKQHFTTHLQTVDTSGRRAFARWGVDCHNEVNARLGKPIVSVDAAHDAARAARTRAKRLVRNL